jgi:probable rRNA maturation factor
MSDPPSRLTIDVVDGRGRALRKPGLARWLARVAPRAARGELTVALVTDARVRALDRTYRKKDVATDVLSFPVEPRGQAKPRRSAEREGGRPEARGHSEARGQRPEIRGGLPEARSLKPEAYLGDIVIARGVAARQARAAGHPVDTELRILALHGLLHLIGYDHERDAGQMRRLEERLRRKGGLKAGLIERAR